MFAANRRASSRVSSLAAEHAGAGDKLCPGKLLPIIGWTEVAFESLQSVAK
jgi:hypothetical protein